MGKRLKRMVRRGHVCKYVRCMYVVLGGFTEACDPQKRSSIDLMNVTAPCHLTRLPQILLKQTNKQTDLFIGHPSGEC